MSPKKKCSEIGVKASTHGIRLSILDDTNPKGPTAKNHYIDGLEFYKFYNKVCAVFDYHDRRRREKAIPPEIKEEPKGV